MFKFNLQIINHLSRFFIENGEEITAKDALILDNHYQQVTLSGEQKVVTKNDWPWLAQGRLQQNHHSSFSH